MGDLISKSGRPLAKVATITTTPTSSSALKKIYTQHETIEVIISDSRMISMGSQFGHTAIVIDGIEYGRAHPGWDRDTKERYLYRQQVSMHRDSWGYVLKVTASEKQIMLSEIRKRMAENKLYSIADNSCSSNLAEILEAAGIQAHDPRFEFMDTISPSDLMVGLKHSRRLLRENVYPKK
ncbi:MULTISPECIES: DUF4105 domain-containing protein [Ralstonia solanacearum species complex]|nr:MULTISPECIES: DUF4105 domain-containing protein [Ralstonia]AXV68641.1 DUF4105 domain-containing protein [Ralstonia solanacearum]AXV94998.1 DUF4105 domain-containing protein [Ralstonia solanacearum]AXW00211.1 DUF4105 domain-containing protein [Ralstonia solanacearum]AXW27702.1 DUF4105 domain-containing protein [Ralstonia solanacearum]AXW32689.1 DUF4105 domain-containing protein [Ralstonia solanacearum]